jgi:lysophospholipid hydrolase
LKEPPLVKPDVNELHPDVNTGKQANLMRSFLTHVFKDPPPTFHNYLDDFLQAVRVFGFVSSKLFKYSFLKTITMYAAGKTGVY